MDMNVFKEMLFESALRAGFEEAEIFYQKIDSMNIHVYKGEVEKFQNNNIGGFGFRGLYNGVMGYSYSEIVDEGIIDEVIEGAKQNAEIINQEEKEFIYSGDKEYADVNIYNEDINNITMKQKISAAKLMEETAKNYDECIRDVNTTLIDNGESVTYIANTNGMELSEKSNYILAYIDVIAERDGQTKECGEIWFGDAWSKFKPKELAEKAAKKAVSYLGAKSINSGSMPVIIKNEAFVDLLDCFKSNFYAENVQKGFSLLKEKLGKSIASELITLVDEPLLEGGFATTSFDSEGVAAYNKTIIEKGILKIYLHNLKSAYKDGTKSTGNGFKSSFKSSVNTSTTNFYIKNGTKSFGDLISDLSDGMLITELSGMHAGTNSITGDFSLAASGFLIENGEIVRPVEQITAAGNFYKMLKDITAVGNDLYFSTSAVGSPSIAINQLDISGN